jgi:hypothetical protein
MLILKVIWINFRSQELTFKASTSFTSNYWVRVKQWPLARYSRRLACVLAKKGLASTLFLSYLPNLPRASTYFFNILAKLDTRKLLFSTYLPNLTRASFYFWHTRQTWLGKVTTSTQNAPQTLCHKILKPTHFSGPKSDFRCYSLNFFYRKLFALIFSNKFWGE